SKLFLFNPVHDFKRQPHAAERDQNARDDDAGRYQIRKAQHLFFDERKLFQLLFAQVKLFKHFFRDRKHFFYVRLRFAVNNDVEYKLQDEDEYDHRQDKDDRTIHPNFVRFFLGMKERTDDDTPETGQQRNRQRYDRGKQQRKSERDEKH